MTEYSDKRQPKYTFGQPFTKEENVQWEGVWQRVKTTHFIVAIQATPSTSDFEYQYKLATPFPEAYLSWDFCTDFITESKVEELYTIKESIK